MDMLGYFLHGTLRFKGKGRLVRKWLEKAKSGVRMRRLAGGGTIRCDIAVPYEAMVWLGLEEEEDLIALGRILRPGDTFVDCGANIGLWSLSAARMVGEQGRTFSFEPNRATFGKLAGNVRDNKLEKTVIISNKACGNFEGEAAFVCSPEHNNSHVARGEEKGVEKVAMTTLDAAIPEGRVHGIKIDVEGGEWAVLDGATTILEKWYPWICVEFNAVITGNSRLGGWQVHQWLRKRGYACTLMKEVGDRRPGNRLNDDSELQGYHNLFYSLP